jgi:hypothetical protein
MADEKKKDSDKKKNASEAEAEWVTCTGYELQIDTVRDWATLKGILPGTLNLTDEKLLKKALKAIADTYPDVGWQFQVEDRKITDVRSKSEG